MDMCSDVHKKYRKTTNIVHLLTIAIIQIPFFYLFFLVGEKRVDVVSEVTSPPTDESNPLHSAQMQTASTSESDEDHWEGWGEQQQEDVIDSDIDREIEQEIRSMDIASIKPEHHETSTVLLSPSNASESFSTSDVSTHKDNVVAPTRKGILKLAKTRTSPPPLLSPSAVKNTGELSSAHSPSRKHIHAPETAKREDDLQQKKTVKCNMPLGAEFDIKAIKIKTDSKAGKGAVEDFFADMEPVIKTDTDILALLMNKSKPGDNVQIEEKKASTLSFAFQDDTVSYAIRKRCMGIVTSIIYGMLRNYII